MKTRNRLRVEPGEPGCVSPRNLFFNRFVAFFVVISANLRRPTLNVTQACDVLGVHRIESVDSVYHRGTETRRSDQSRSHPSPRLRGSVRDQFFDRDKIPNNNWTYSRFLLIRNWSPGLSSLGAEIEPAMAVLAAVEVATIRVKAKRQNFTVKISHYEHKWHANAESLKN